MHRMQFRLVRIAKSNGGDRYECGVKGDPEYMVIYIPQYISRQGAEGEHLGEHLDGSIRKELTITIE